jgi:hypothetical protein
MTKRKIKSQFVELSAGMDEYVDDAWSKENPAGELEDILSGMLSVIVCNNRFCVVLIIIKIYILNFYYKR